MGRIESGVDSIEAAVLKEVGRQVDANGVLKHGFRPKSDPCTSVTQTLSMPNSRSPRIRSGIDAHFYLQVRIVILHDIIHHHHRLQPPGLPLWNVVNVSRKINSVLSNVTTISVSVSLAPVYTRIGKRNADIDNCACLDRYPLFDRQESRAGQGEIPEIRADAGAGIPTPLDSTEALCGGRLLWPVSIGLFGVTVQPVN